MASKPAAMNRAQKRQCVQRRRPREEAQCLGLVKALVKEFREMCNMEYIHPLLQNEHVSRTWGGQLHKEEPVIQYTIVLLLFLR